jgi:hypothetical protein
MTTPGGAGTPPCTATTSSVLGAPASIMGSELPPLPRYGAPVLHFPRAGVTNLERLGAPAPIGVGLSGSVLYNASTVGRVILYPLLFSTRPSLCPAPMPQGVSYVQVSGLGLYIRNLMPIGTRLPCQRSWVIWGGALGFADELRFHGVLRSCLPPESLSRLVAGAARLVGGEQLSERVASRLFGKGVCSGRPASPLGRPSRRG